MNDHTSALAGQCLESPCHLGVIVTDLGAAMETYGRALNLSWTSVRRTDTRMRLGDREVELAFELVWSVDGPVHIELIQELPGTPWVAAEGAPFHHAGYLVDDLVSGVHELEQSGFSVEATRFVEGAAVMRFAYMRHPLGLRIELMDRQMMGDLGSWIAEGSPR
jgi:hypothetical protein